MAIFRNFGVKWYAQCLCADRQLRHWQTPAVTAVFLGTTKNYKQGAVHHVCGYLPTQVFQVCLISLHFFV